MPEVHIETRLIPDELPVQLKPEVIGNRPSIQFQHREAKFAAGIKLVHQGRVESAFFRIVEVAALSKQRAPGNLLMEEVGQVLVDLPPRLYMTEHQPSF